MAFNEEEYKKKLQGKTEEQYKSLIQSLGPRFQKLLSEEASNIIQQKAPSDLTLSGGSYNPKSGLGLQFDVPETYADPSLYQGMEPTRGTFKVPGGSVTYEQPEEETTEDYMGKLESWTQKLPPGYDKLTVTTDAEGNPKPTYTYMNKSMSVRTLPIDKRIELLDKYITRISKNPDVLQKMNSLTWAQRSKNISSHFGLSPSRAGLGIDAWIGQFLASPKARKNAKEAFFKSGYSKQTIARALIKRDEDPRDFGISIYKKSTGISKKWPKATQERLAEEKGIIPKKVKRPKIPIKGGGPYYPSIKKQMRKRGLKQKRAYEKGLKEAKFKAHVRRTKEQITKHKKKGKRPQTLGRRIFGKNIFGRG